MPSLALLCRDARFQQLAIAEINAAGRLHQFLRHVPRLLYSEYGGQGDVQAENLLALTYDDESVDLVVTSDTLEHVPDVHVALCEIRRILKPRGAHVFSTPVVWGRDTRKRAAIEDGAIVHHLPPSYHGSIGNPAYFVFYEFGADFIAICQRAGFRIEVLQDPSNRALTTFIGWRFD